MRQHRRQMLVYWGVLGLTAEQAAARGGWKLSAVSAIYREQDFLEEVSRTRADIIGRALVSRKAMKVHERIAEMAPQALDQLQKLLDIKGKPDALVLRAAQDVLDRYPETQRGESWTFKLDPEALRTAAVAADEMDRVIDVTPEAE